MYYIIGRKIETRPSPGWVFAPIGLPLNNPAMDRQDAVRGTSYNDVSTVRILPAADPSANR